MRYKITIAYDGTDYHGWQEQPNNPTIAGTLQDVFLKVFHENIVLLGASRTDAGVHALGQVATFTSDLAICPDQLQEAWNNKLQKSITINSLEPVPDSYNPHVGVVQKEYRYVFTLTRPSPFDARFVYHYRWPIALQKLQAALSVFVGEHDFRSFCTGTDLTDTIRTVESISLIENYGPVPSHHAVASESWHRVPARPELVEGCEQPGQYTIIFKAPGFLRYMIRRVTGACLEVASRPQLELSDLKKVLENKNPEHTLPCAPAHGLTLVKILYQDS